MGMVEKQRGRADLAENAYRQALEIDPNNVVALEQSGVDRDDEP
jgi:Flp pilus assembly protein TadD